MTRSKATKRGGARLRLNQRELELLDAALAVYLDGLQGAINHDEPELQLLRLRVQQAQWEMRLVSKR